MDLPSWVSADEDKPAPMPLLRVQAFVNTLDVDQGSDLLRADEAASAWLADAGLVAPGTAVSDEQLHMAREVRGAIRALLRRNSGTGCPDSDQLRTLQTLAEGHSPAVGVRPDGNPVGLRRARGGRPPLRPSLARVWVLG